MQIANLLKLVIHGSSTLPRKDTAPATKIQVQSHHQNTGQCFQCSMFVANVFCNARWFIVNSHRHHNMHHAKNENVRKRHQIATDEIDDINNEYAEQLPISPSHKHHSSVPFDNFNGPHNKEYFYWQQNGGLEASSLVSCSVFGSVEQCYQNSYKSTWQLRKCWKDHMGRITPLLFCINGVFFSHTLMAGSTELHQCGILRLSRPLDNFFWCRATIWLNGINLRERERDDNERSWISNLLHLFLGTILLVPSLHSEWWHLRTRRVAW